MKILHTADWHLGHRLHEQSQFEEQSQFLNWLEVYIHDNQIDVLLISGDVFDTGVPSAQSQTMYYNFLINLKKTSCQHVVITGGNHDAPGTLNAPKGILHSLSIHVVGKATENIEEEVFVLSVKDEKVIIAAVPFLRDQDIRRAVAAESFEQIGNRYKMALIKHYKEVAEYCKTLKTNTIPAIAMGHLFAIGGSTSESEQTIYVGNLGDIGAGDFPEVFDYVALGHLHRAQKIDNLDRIRYSGSPYMLSFSEIEHKKKIILLQTDNEKINSLEEIDVPLFRQIRRIRGSYEECVTQLLALDTEEYELKPWVEVILNNEINTYFGFSEIHKAAEGLNLEVLKVTLKNERKIAGLEKLIQNAQNVNELSPNKVFELKCREQHFDLDANPEILDAFNEVLQIAREG